MSIIAILTALRPQQNGVDEVLTQGSDHSEFVEKTILWVPLVQPQFSRIVLHDSFKDSKFCSDAQCDHGWCEIHGGQNCRPSSPSSSTGTGRSLAHPASVPRLAARLYRVSPPLTQGSARQALSGACDAPETYLCDAMQSADALLLVRVPACSLVEVC